MGAGIHTLVQQGGNLLAAAVIDRDAHRRGLRQGKTDAGGGIEGIGIVLRQLIVLHRQVSRFDRGRGEEVFDHSCDLAKVGSYQPGAFIAQDAALIDHQAAIVGALVKTAHASALQAQGIADPGEIAETGDIGQGAVPKIHADGLEILAGIRLIDFRFCGWTNR